MILNKRISSVKKVLIYVDQKRRDYYPAKRISKELNKYGINVKISGKISFLPTISYWKPHVIIFGNHDCYHGDWIRNIYNSYIFSLGTEQGTTYKSFLKKRWFQGHSYIRPPAHEFVDCFLVYNQFTKSYLDSKLKNAVVEVIGSPRLYSKKLFKKARPLKNKNLTIGIICGEDITSFSSVFSYFKEYFNLEKVNPKYFSDFNNLQGILTFFLLEKLFINFLLERLKKEFPKANFLARLRFDSDKTYIKNLRGVDFDQTADPTFFISKCDVVITAQSTLGFECMMSGIPAISIIKQLNPGVLFKKCISRNFTRSLHQPDSLEDIYKLINERLRSKLAISPNMEDFLDTSKKCFYNNLETDESIKKIVKLVKKAPIKDKEGAKLNHEKLFVHLDETSSISNTSKLWIVLSKINPFFFHLGNLIAKLRFRSRNDLYFE